MSTLAKILIIDDEPDIRELLEITLNRMGHSCVCAASRTEALEALKKQTFALCLTDMNLGDGTGIEVIEFIQLHCPDLPVAMITAYGNTETAIDAMKAGAFDYVAKPIDLTKLRALITAGLRVASNSKKEDASAQLLGDSEQMQNLRSKIQKLSRSLAPVFINGESGSGKELVARMIHQLGSRASKPFIAVNCGAIPSELMESEFFGHEKGSFTGADDKKTGLFKAAEGGTLFLDEIADLPKDMQVKLLRAIQEKSIRAVGAVSEQIIDVRILSATHKDLAAEVADNRFRQDLFYRINVIELLVPSLRARAGDIAMLSEHILQKLSKRYEMPAVSLTANANKKLSLYNFPGNVRELENILERAFTLCDSGNIDGDDIHLNTQHNPSNHSETHGTSNKAIDYQQALGNFEGYMEAMEKDILEFALEQTRWNKTAAAELLGISFRTMRYKLKKLNIN
jgi:two-component system response regulator PilR (NtrC family)